MHKKVFSSLYFQVLLAITLGVFLGMSIRNWAPI